MWVRRAVPRRQGLQVHVRERRRRAAGAHDVRLRGALRVQPVHLRQGHDAVRPGEQEAQLLLRAGLQLCILRLGLIVIGAQPAAAQGRPCTC